MKAIHLKLNDEIYDDVQSLSKTIPGGNVTNQINILLREALDNRNTDSE